MIHLLTKLRHILCRPQKGLSLIEVAVAILIVGVSITTLLSLQGILSRGVFGAHTLIERIPYIKNFFVEADRDMIYAKEGKAEKRLEDPPTTLRYSTATPTDAKKFQPFPHVLIEKVEAEWSYLGRTRKESFSMFRFYPKVEKEAS
jgi:prepilin-type N-terminal cleavage/methylation domain-containing protein